MARARLAAIAAMLIVLLGGPAGPAVVPRLAADPVAAVAWPPSSGLVVAEIVTGGASASDEYVELSNASAAPLDLAGLEVAYVTSSGATVTKKAGWTSTTIVEPGRHVLLANSLGVYAAAADVQYSGGLAGTGGAIVLRPTGGTAIDAIGWGDATNTFVEGHGGTRAGRRLVDRAPAGWRRRERPGHERQRRGPRGQRGARRPEPRRLAGARAGAEPDADGRADRESHATAAPTATPDAEPDARCRRRRRPRRRPRPRRRHPTATPARRRPRRRYPRRRRPRRRSRRRAEPDTDPDPVADARADGRAVADASTHGNPRTEPRPDADGHPGTDPDADRRADPVARGRRSPSRSRGSSPTRRRH